MGRAPVRHAALPGLYAGVVDQERSRSQRFGQAAAGVNVGHPLQVTPVLRRTPHVLPLSSGKQSRMLTPANYKTLHEPKPFPLRRKSLRQLAFRTPARRCGSSPASHVFNRGRSRAAGDEANARHWMQLGVVACSAGLPVHQVNVLVGLGFMRLDPAQTPDFPLAAPRPAAEIRLLGPALSAELGREGGVVRKAIPTRAADAPASRQAGWTLDPRT
jgi:hypothetical protein